MFPIADLRGVQMALTSQSLLHSRTRRWRSLSLASIRIPQAGWAQDDASRVQTAAGGGSAGDRGHSHRGRCAPPPETQERDGVGATRRSGAPLRTRPDVHDISPCPVSVACPRSSSKQSLPGRTFFRDCTALPPTPPFGPTSSEGLPSLPPPCGPPPLLPP